MSFLAPWALLAAAGVAAALVALHFIAPRRPRRSPLPTARFIPEQSVRAPSRSARPTDLLLLLVRVLTVLLLGAGFARPVWPPARRGVARVVALDVSRSTRSVTEARDSAIALLGDGDLLVLFDSVARIVAGETRDSLRALAIGGAGAAGSLSGALVAALRAAPTLGDRTDSLELVLISPFAREEWDGATAAIRALWRGRVRLVSLAAADSGSGRMRDIEVRAPADDPLRATVQLIGARSRASAVRLERGAPERADTTWASAPGHVLIRWPSEPPVEWAEPAGADSAGAVIAGDAIVVAPFARESAPPAGRPVARWVDGRPAATERPVGEGCVRDVAVHVPAEGDLALSESAQRLVLALAEPCGGTRALAPLEDSSLALLRGEGALLDARAIRPRPAMDRSPATWLLVAAAVLIAGESLLRRSGGHTS